MITAIKSVGFIIAFLSVIISVGVIASLAELIMPGPTAFPLLPLDAYIFWGIGGVVGFFIGVIYKEGWL